MPIEDEQAIPNTNLDVVDIISIFISQLAKSF